MGRLVLACRRQLGSQRRIVSFDVGVSAVFIVVVGVVAGFVVEDAVAERIDVVIVGLAQCLPERDSKELPTFNRRNQLALQ